MKKLSPSQRESMFNEIYYELLTQKKTQGEVLKFLRSKFLNLNQSDYCKLVGISRKALSDLENDRGGQSVKTTDKAFKPLGLKLGLVPIQAEKVEELLSKT